MGQINFFNIVHVAIRRKVHLDLGQIGGGGGERRDGIADFLDHVLSTSPFFHKKSCKLLLAIMEHQGTHDINVINVN